MKTCGKPHYDTLGIVVNCSEETPCRDCLLVEVGRLEYLVQSLQGEQAARSAPVAVRLMIPDWETIEDYAGVFPRGSVEGTREARTMRRVYDYIEAHALAVPSDRVLKEGEREELEILREIADIARPRVRKLDKAALCDATRRLDAVRLRSQRTENEGSNHHASN